MGSHNSKQNTELDVESLLNSESLTMNNKNDDNHNHNHSNSNSNKNNTQKDEEKEKRNVEKPTSIVLRQFTEASLKLRINK
jgi:hypothetical protein